MHDNELLHVQHLRTQSLLINNSITFSLWDFGSQLSFRNLSLMAYSVTADFPKSIKKN